ncbi:MAG: RNA-binding S4 domain-containing protein [Bacteroidales bacterium]|nr:RNA-binding S4 domain-containing protein [Bacteroidales bacterium]
MDTIRVDKWLWVVRLFKTRSLAGAACRGGKVKINQQTIKPSKEIKIGDIIEVQLNQLNKIVQVKQLSTNRVAAKLVDQLMTDLTPTEEYERIQIMKEYKAVQRKPGSGRPTKKERRELDSLKNNF